MNGRRRTTNGRQGESSVRRVRARRRVVMLQRVWAGVLDVGRGSDEVLRGQPDDELHDDERRGRENREEEASLG
jgi:hypothetical protein